jgi:hypothetical protein
MRKLSRIVGALAVLAALLVVGAADAAAQQQPARRAGPRVIRLEEITIEGQIQKPNAFYVLQRSNLGFEVMELRTSFVEEIVRSVRTEPF